MLVVSDSRWIQPQNAPSAEQRAYLYDMKRAMKVEALWIYDS